LLRPILAGIFAMGQACNASVFHLDEKIGAVTSSIPSFFEIKESAGA